MTVSNSDWLNEAEATEAVRPKPVTLEEIKRALEQGRATAAERNKKLAADLELAASREGIRVLFVDEVSEPVLILPAWYKTTGLPPEEPPLNRLGLLGPPSITTERSKTGFSVTASADFVPLKAPKP